MRFWDSSALVPLTVPEPQSAACAQLYEQDADIVVWALSSVEVAAALQRRRREDGLKTAGLAAAWARLEQLSARWSEIIDLEIVRARAERLIAVHSLRAADALQLAAALVACDERPQRVAFVCLDRRLADAANREGFTVLPADSAPRSG